MLTSTGSWHRFRKMCGRFSFLLGAEPAGNIGRFSRYRLLTVTRFWRFETSWGGEPNLRGLIDRVHEAGATVLLPAVIRKAEPLVFRSWSPGCAMEHGIWNIPVPADGTDLRPNVVVAPLVGADRDCYRLGNGGGYYDRTLAGLDPLPRVIGVGSPTAASRPSIRCLGTSRCTASFWRMTRCSIESDVRRRRIRRS